MQVDPPAVARIDIAPPRSTGTMPSSDRSRARPRRSDGPIERTTASFGLWPWALLAEREGTSIERFCELAGISQSALRDPGVRFSQPVCNDVAELAYELFGPGAAMQAALLNEAGHFQLLELIVRTAPNIEVGLERGCLFFPLLHDGGHLHCERLAHGRIALCWNPPQSYPVHHGYVELTFAVALVGIRRETGASAASAEEVWFTHPAPDDLELHRRVLGVEPRFGMSQDRAIFGAEVTALRLTRENAAVHSAATEAGTEFLGG